MPFCWLDNPSSDETEEFVKCDIRTEFIPLTLVNSPNFDWPVEDSSEFHPDNLSEMGDPLKLKDALLLIHTAYSNWLSEQKEKPYNPCLNLTETSH